MDRPKRMAGLAKRSRWPTPKRFGEAIRAHQRGRSGALRGASLSTEVQPVVSSKCPGSATTVRDLQRRRLAARWLKRRRRRQMRDATTMGRSTSNDPWRVSPRGFEPLTFGSGGRRSIQLSYGDACVIMAEMNLQQDPNGVGQKTSGTSPAHPARNGSPGENSSRFPAR